MFGIDQGHVEPFLTRRGFHNVRNVPLEDLRSVYLSGPNAGRLLPTGIAIVSATVNKDGEWAVPALISHEGST